MSWRAVLRIAQHIGAVVLVSLFAFGAVMLATVVEWWIPATAIVAFGVGPVLVTRWVGANPSGWRLALVIVVVVAVSVLVLLLGLLGFNVVWAAAGLPRPGAAAGLAIAGVVVGATAYIYLRWVGTPVTTHRVRWSVLATLAPIGLYVVTQRDWSWSTVVVALAVGVSTWVFLAYEAGPRIRHPHWWAVLEMEAIVLGIPFAYDAYTTRRLSGMLALAAIVGLVAMALWLRRKPEVTVRRGSMALAIAVIPVICLATTTVGSSEPSDAHVLPQADASLSVPALARRHRPVLLFDHGETVGRPLNIEAMLATGDFDLCPRDDGILADCDPLASAAELRNGVGNLRFDTKDVTDADLATTIYVHAARDPQAHPDRLYLDYWWYMPDNPAYTAKGAMCGSGLVIPEITCFDHQSDWEGVTVVLRQSDGEPVEVHYAAHEHVFNVPWAVLKTAERPRVYIAAGTHAAYPTSCAKSSCDAAGAVFNDNRHDGGQPWECEGDACLSVLPTGTDGRPAAWNAFDGLWGSPACLHERRYCSRSFAPKSPGLQPRYERPWCYDYEITALTPKVHARAKRPSGCLVKK